MIIPSYNSGHWVTLALDSVLAQTLRPTQIIVVDDGSTDDTAERITPYLDRGVEYVRQPNAGVSAARNNGVSRATGHFVAFLDADDAWHPRKLELQIECFNRHPELGLLGTEEYAWPSDLRPSEHLLAACEPKVILLNDLLVKNRFITSSVMVRKEILDRVGEFDTNQHGTEDYDLWLRIGQVTSMGNLPNPVTGYRRSSAGSLSTNAPRIERGMRIILDKLQASGVFHGRRIVRRKAWAYAQYTWGLMYRQAGHPGVAASQFLRSLANWPGRVHDQDASGGTVTRSLMLMSALLAIVKPGHRAGRTEPTQCLNSPPNQALA